MILYLITKLIQTWIKRFCTCLLCLPKTKLFKNRIDGSQDCHSPFQSIQTIQTFLTSYCDKQLFMSVSFVWLKAVSLFLICQLHSLLKYYYLQYPPKKTAIFLKRSFHQTISKFYFHNFPHFFISPSFFICPLYKWFCVKYCLKMEWTWSWLVKDGVNVNWVNSSFAFSGKLIWKSLESFWSSNKSWWKCH